eukprot:SAG31_NODE_46225_length_255_cov_0.910256_1_plen_34_part_01
MIVHGCGFSVKYMYRVPINWKDSDSGSCGVWLNL